MDVGAGFQEASYATRLPAFDTTIALTCAPEVVYRRWTTRPGNAAAPFDWFCGQEFSPERRAVYDRSHHRIDTTHLTLEQTAERLAGILRSVLR